MPLQHSFIRRIGYALLGMLAYVPAQAGEGGTGAALGVSAQHFTYDEFSPQGRRLVHEHGPLAGALAAYAHAFAEATFRAAISYQGGTAHYHGRTQGGAPLESSAREQIAEVVLAGGRRLGRGEAYAGLGHRQWRRDIRGQGGISGLDERYRWTYVLGGGRLALTPNWALDARLMYPLEAKLEVDFGGAYEKVDLDLHKSPGWRLALPFTMAAGQRTRLQAEFYLYCWEAEQGKKSTLRRAGVPVGRIYEPASEQRVTGVNVIYGWSF